jgi:tetratricopeptide (TPR) repeat protein
MKRDTGRRGARLLLVAAAFLAAPARAQAPEPKPEAVSLLGKPLFAPPVPAANRQRLEDDLARARADFERDPGSAEAIIWLGRRLAYVSRFREAIEVYTGGIAKHPEDVRLYRHRGHRFITVREIDKALADLEKAAALIRGKNPPDEVEPDGTPGPRPPTATTRYNVYYHLGLAHYLKGDFEKARAAYVECLKYSAAPPNQVATSDWLYMTLRRLGRADEARKLLEPIRADLDVGESRSYLNRLLLYKGEKTPDELLRPATDDALTVATQGYGVGNWYLYNGQPEQARALFERVVQGTSWPAFGFVASEAELMRMKAAEPQR